MVSVLLLYLLLFFLVIIFFASIFFKEHLVAFFCMLIGGSIGFAISHLFAPILLQGYGETTREYFTFIVAVTISFITASILKWQFKRKGRY